MNLSNFEFERHSNPVDMIEFVAASNDWTFERSGEHEIAMTVEGHWTDYHVSFSWMEDCEALHIATQYKAHSLIRHLQRISPVRSTSRFPMFALPR